MMIYIDVGCTLEIEWMCVCVCVFARFLVIFGTFIDVTQNITRDKCNFLTVSEYCFDYLETFNHYHLTLTLSLNMIIYMFLFGPFTLLLSLSHSPI